MPSGIYKHKSNQGFQKGNKIGIHNSEIMKEIAKQKGYGKWMKGKKLPLKTRKKMSEAHRGEKAYQWKGGISLLSRFIRHCFKYRQWRSDVFTRDDFTCQECGVRGGDLEAHHIKPFYKIIKENNIKTLQGALDCEELWNINNGRTLCLQCHRKSHKSR
ncbi:MAG: HNH endonuclease [Candidatus Heimdallarchaeaceae archaeon]